MTRPWGLAHVLLTYDPPVTDASALSFVQQLKPDAPDLAACWSQAAPARPLPNLRGIPVLIATTEASYHAVYDHCTADYLQQAGVDVDFERLADHGIKGNGHMMMLEKNNLQIAAFWRLGSSNTFTENKICWAVAFGRVPLPMWESRHRVSHDPLWLPVSDHQNTSWWNRPLSIIC